MYLRQLRREDQRDRLRINWEPAVVIADEESVIKPDFDISGIQFVAVRRPQHRQQDFIFQLWLQRIPINIKEAGVLRSPAVLEHILPPGVIAKTDSHMVRN